MQEHTGTRLRTPIMLSGLILLLGGALFLFALTQPTTFGASKLSWGSGLPLTAACAVALGFIAFAWSSVRRGRPHGVSWSIALAIVGIERLVALLLLAAPFQSFTALVVLQCIVFLAGIYVALVFPQRQYNGTVRWFLIGVVILFTVSFAAQYLFANGPLVTAFILQTLLPIAFVCLGISLVFEARLPARRRS
ncbi:hypothetical protein [Curtobacterium sp. MCLR17_034]|uniref:hypothetical protein n=1 Tax=Curtobacterium sp. MCLR17_034 TaxID=2175623 RepID=UPI0011B724BA|nr:hypothetical protein [Curtobacterium sp. MCLR17_034]